MSGLHEGSFAIVSYNSDILLQVSGEETAIHFQADRDGEPRATDAGQQLHHPLAGVGVRRHPSDGGGAQRDGDPAGHGEPEQRCTARSATALGRGIKMHTLLCYRRVSSCQDDTLNPKSLGFKVLNPKP